MGFDKMAVCVTRGIKGLKPFDDRPIEAECIHALVDVLIASLDLVAVVDDAVALGG